MENMRNKYMQLGSEALKNCSLIVSEYSEGKEKELQLNTLLEIMGNYCELDAQYDNSLKAMSEAKKLMKNKHEEAEQDGGDDRSICEVYRELLAKSKDTKQIAKKSAKFKVFKEHIDRLQKEASEELEDVQMSQITLNPVDPLTKKIMVDPVRSCKCGHTFEKDSIEHLLRLKKKLRCPIPGCPHQITKDDLESDLQMKQFLQKMTKSQQQASHPGPSSHIGGSL